MKAAKKVTTPEIPPSSLVGSNAGETLESVRNVIEFMAWHSLDGENTAEVADGRRLILESCSYALAHAMLEVRNG